MAVDATYSISQAPNILKPEAPTRINMSKIFYAVPRLGPRGMSTANNFHSALTARGAKTAFNSTGNQLCFRSEFLISSYTKIRVFWDNITSKNADNSILSGIRNRDW